MGQEPTDADDEMVRQMERRRHARPERRQRRLPHGNERRRMCSFCYQPGDHPTAESLPSRTGTTLRRSTYALTHSTELRHYPSLVAIEFELGHAAAHELEGIVGKLASGRYHADGTSTNWCKIKNPAYTQMTARHELFERRTGSRKRRPMLRVP